MRSSKSNCMAELERVESFRYLGLQFDKKLLWAEHIGKIVEKCKKVLNVMRCQRRGVGG